MNHSRTERSPVFCEPGSEARAAPVLGGKYRIELLLGSGGMGEVYAATHLELRHRVAIKVLRREISAVPDFVARFGREARNAAKMRGEHAAHIHDIGRLEDGTPYLVMEHLEGRDLAQVLEERGKAEIADAVEWVRQACEAVAEAHTLGIVHRDLKPSNLFLTQRYDGTPCIKVLDFGLSKALHPSTEVSAVATRGWIGTPSYMSPEQMTNPAEVDGRTDAWSLGVILFKLLAGTLPFPARTALELGARVVSAPPLSLRTHRPEVPLALEAIVLRCLDKDPARRMGIGELLRALTKLGTVRAEEQAATTPMQAPAFAETAEFVLERRARKNASSRLARPSLCRAAYLFAAACALAALVLFATTARRVLASRSSTVSHPADAPMVP